MNFSVRDKPPQGEGFIYAAYSGGGCVKVGKTILSPRSRLTKIRGKAREKPFDYDIFETMELVPSVLCCPLQVHHQTEKLALNLAAVLFEPLPALGREYFRAGPYENSARIGFDYVAFFQRLSNLSPNATLHTLYDTDLRWERGNDDGVVTIGAPMGAGPSPSVALAVRRRGAAIEALDAQGMLGLIEARDGGTP